MEFDLIKTYFTDPFSRLLADKKGMVGIGDDCASFPVATGHKLYVSVDSLVEGVHFFEHENPASVGWKTLAVNLSDLAASGAKPLAFTLSIALPAVNSKWLKCFSDGLLSVASEYDCPLIGGDTSSTGVNAPIVIAVQVFGTAPESHHGFHRSNAQKGDDIWISGRPGLARVGLLLLARDKGRLCDFVPAPSLDEVASVMNRLSRAVCDEAVQALKHPIPRLALSQKLSPYVNAMIDLSDGLEGDLTHILTSSALGADLDCTSLRALWDGQDDDCIDWLTQQSLIGGDDYELCWTSPASTRDAVSSMAAELKLPINRIGQITHKRGLNLIGRRKVKLQPAVSHQHFR